MKKYFTYPIIIMLLITAFGCKKDNDIDAEAKVELYLLESFSTVENSYEIRKSSIVTKSSPLIAYEDFISYNFINYTFKVSDDAKALIENLELSVFGVAFAVVADNEVIYSGYFWPGYSSSSCDWVTIDPIWVNLNNELKVHLGYPWVPADINIPDNRNDSRILQIFERDNKLIW